MLIPDTVQIKLTEVQPIFKLFRQSNKDPEKENFMQEESEIIKGCLDGNRFYQKRLFDVYSKRMLSVCMYYTKNKDEAKDILQEGFIKVFRNMDKYRHDGAFEAWMRRIMVNTALDYFRKNKQEHLMYGTETADAEIQVDPSAVQKMQADDIIKLIQKMPEGYQVVFSLYAIEGYNHKEIGEMLGISEGTSKSQYARGRVYLQKLMKGYENSQTEKHLQER